MLTDRLAPSWSESPGRQKSPKGEAVGRGLLGRPCLHEGKGRKATPSPQTRQEEKKRKQRLRIATQMRT
jgi:hypothetical protein